MLGWKKCTLAGRAMERTGHRWVTRLTEWISIGGTRSRGRQITQWRDELRKFWGQRMDSGMVKDKCG